MAPIESACSSLPTSACIGKAFPDWLRRKTVLCLAGAASYGRVTSRLRRGAQPDVVLIDATLCADLIVVERSLQRRERPAWLHLSRPTTKTISLAGLRAGVSGFLSWEASSHGSLCEILRRAARGESPCSPDVVDAFLRRAREKPGEDCAVRGVLDYAASANRRTGCRRVVKQGNRFPPLHRASHRQESRA